MRHVKVARFLATIGLVLSAVSLARPQPAQAQGFQTIAPTAILMDAESHAVLFEKNADELTAPASMAKTMTAEVVFNAIKEGKIKLTDEYRISENAWRKGGAPSGGSTMFASINSRVPAKQTWPALSN